MLTGQLVLTSAITAGLPPTILRSDSGAPSNMIVVQNWVEELKAFHRKWIANFFIRAEAKRKIDPPAVIVFPKRSAETQFTFSAQESNLGFLCR